MNLKKNVLVLLGEILMVIATGATLSACGESAQEKLARQQLEAQEKDRQQTNQIRESRHAAEEAFLKNNAPNKK